ncbi:hypothetical protein D3C81_1598760 [compost metagenome]
MSARTKARTRAAIAAQAVVLAKPRVPANAATPGARARLAVAASNAMVAVPAAKNARPAPTTVGVPVVMAAVAVVARTVTMLPGKSRP